MYVDMYVAIIAVGVRLGFLELGLCWGHWDLVWDTSSSLPIDWGKSYKVKVQTQ